MKRKLSFFILIGAIYLHGIACQNLNSAVESGHFRFPFFPEPSTGSDEAAESNCNTEVTCGSFFKQKYPTLNGTCNNRVDPKKGIINHSFKRFLQPDYSRLNSRGFLHLPGARSISNFLQARNLSQSSKSTQMLPLFGQFIAHDFTLTLGPDAERFDCSCNAPEQECINIPIPQNDPQYSFRKTCFQLTRSTQVKDTDNCESSVRQQGNELTGFLDMGLIYGTTEAQKEALREKSNRRKGELISQRRNNLLPQFNQNEDLEAAQEQTSCPHNVIRPTGAACFISGEPRTNENSVLISHHTIWMRLHNVVVQGLKKVNPSWDSDKLFETARTIVIAVEQRVTYEHFLPDIIGPQYMKAFKLNLLDHGYWYGYDSSYDATIVNSFAAAAFRMGHPLINKNFKRPNPSWSKPQGPSIRVKDALNNIGAVLESTRQTSRAGGPNSFIRGLASEPSSTFDTTFSNDLRNFIESTSPETNVFGSDLLARNIQRGRDHGLPSYVRYREFCGLSVPRRFDDMLPYANYDSINKLGNIYNTIADVDLFAGATAENSVENGTVGPTFACIIAYQFRDTKNGDRFWHENPPPIGIFSERQLAAIRDYSLPRLLCDVVDDMSSIQRRPLRQVGPENRRRRCRRYKRLDFRPWQENHRHTSREFDQDTEWTTWFPMCISTRFVCTEFLTVSETYDWLLVNRPTEVCRQVVGNEVRTIGSGSFARSQVRFECLPGEISHSDFPQIPNDKLYWSRWTSNNAEFLLLRNQCGRAYAIQAQTRPRPGVVTPIGQTSIVFNEFSPAFGISCSDADQSSHFCPTVFVRLLCRRRPRGFPF